MTERLRKAWAKNPKMVVVSTVLELIIIFTAIFCVLALSKPRVVSTTIASDQRLSLLSPLKFNFSSPVSRRSFEATLVPTIAGSWEWGNSAASHLQSQVSFIPESSWQPDQTYTVTLVAQNILESKTEHFVSSFRTASVPNVASTSVSDAVDVSPTNPISVSLTSINDGVADFNFAFDPPVAVDSVLSEDGLTYTLTPTEPLQLGTAYHLVISRQLTFRLEDDQAVVSRGQEEDIFATSFVTRPPAQLSSFSPQGSSVLPNVNVVDIRFKEPMERSSVESNITFSPGLPGTWQWVNDSEVKYVLSKSLEFDTVYRVTIAAATKAQSGVTFVNDTVETFKTVGNLLVIGVSPRNKATGVSRGTTISLTFDQPAEQTSIEGSFSLSPKVGGTFSWRRQTVIFTPAAPLDFSTTYTVQLSTNARSAFGKQLSNPFAAQFTTEEKTVLLDVASRRQEHALSCEAASLKMALSYRGIIISEDDIMGRIGYDPTIRDGNIWGDPNQAFVGDINGTQNISGYGVHWGPVALAARTWRPAASFSGWTVRDLAHQIDEGNPIVVWGTIGIATPDSWQTPLGQQINVWKGEHTRLIVGYRGNADNPTGFILNDPVAGRISWSTSKLQSNWSSYGNSGVVIQ